MTTFWWLFLGACVWAILIVVVLALLAVAAAHNAAMDAAEDEGPEAR